MFWKLCLLSIFVHGAFIALPWPQSAADPEREAVSDVSTATEQPSAINAVTLPIAASLNEARPTRDNTTAQVESASNNSAVASSPAPVQQLPIEQPIVQQLAKPLTEQPIQQSPPQNVHQSAIPDESQQQAVIDTEAFSTDPKPTAESPLGGEPEYGKVMTLRESFPHLAGSEAGCYGLQGCRQLGGNFRSVADALKGQMIGQGYQLTERNDIDNTGHLVFEAIAPQEPEKIYYLNLFSSDAGSTVYVITTEVISLEELKQLSR